MAGAKASVLAPSASGSRLSGLLVRTDAFFDMRQTMSSRILTLIAVLLLIPAFFMPLYTMTLYSNQFPDGLVLNIYSGSLAGGVHPDREDLSEINTLNHYIGMKPLMAADFTEFKWIPLMLGFFMIMGLRSAVLGKMSHLVDTLVAFAWFGAFAAWHFYDRLHTYGHNLDPTAPVKVPPFTPPILGSKQMANFTVYNFPGIGTYVLLAFVALLAVAIFLTARQRKAA